MTQALKAKNIKHSNIKTNINNYSKSNNYKQIGNVNNVMVFFKSASFGPNKRGIDSK